MENILTFKSNESLVKLARETIEADKFKLAYENIYTKNKCFYLVKDEGIYLMDAYDTNKTSKDNGTVVYADSFDPSNDPHEDLWERTYQVSRDDFAQNIYLVDNQLQRLAEGGDMKIKLCEFHYEVEA